MDRSLGECGLKLLDREAFKITEGLYDNDGSRRVFFWNDGDAVTFMSRETAKTLAADICPYDPAISALIDRALSGKAPDAGGP